MTTTPEYTRISPSRPRVRSRAVLLLLLYIYIYLDFALYPNLVDIYEVASPRIVEAIYAGDFVDSTEHYVMCLGGRGV